MVNCIKGWSEMAIIILTQTPAVPAGLLCLLACQACVPELHNICSVPLYTLACWCLMSDMTAVLTVPAKNAISL